MKSKQNLLMAKTAFLFSALWVISAFVVSFLGPIGLNSTDFIIALMFCVSIKGLFLKEKFSDKKYLKYAVYFLASLVLVLIFYGLRLHSVGSYVFYLHIFLSSFFTWIQVEGAVMYAFEKEWIPKIAILFLAMSLISFFLGFEDMKNMTRIYVFFLLFSLFTMDFERVYQLKAENKRRENLKFIAMVGVVVVTWESVFSVLLFWFSKLSTFFWDKIAWLLGEVLTIFLMPVLKPLGNWTEKIKQRLTQSGDLKALENFEQSNKANMEPMVDAAKETSSFDFGPILHVLKIAIFVAVLLWISWKIFKRLKGAGVTKTWAQEEIFVENIENFGAKKKRSFARGKEGNNEKIRYIYQDLLRLAKKKRRYEESMSVSEFERAVALDSEQEALLEMGRLFNRSVFSTQIAHEQEVKQMKRHAKMVMGAVRNQETKEMPKS